jgi:predicted transcriptional regulator
MKRKPPAQLTEAELRIMNVVWEKGKATVAEVSAELAPELGLAYNTVLTTMRILETKGFLRHAKPKDARAFVYRPLVGRVDATRHAVRQLLRRFFDDSPQSLVLNLLEDEALDAAELENIRKLINEKPEEKL